MLTDTQFRTAKPKDKPYKMSDGNGLYLEIKPNGVKAWRYRFELREGTLASYRVNLTFSIVYWDFCRL